MPCVVSCCIMSHALSLMVGTIQSVESTEHLLFSFCAQTSMLMLTNWLLCSLLPKLYYNTDDVTLFFWCVIDPLLLPLISRPVKCSSVSKPLGGFATISSPLSIHKIALCMGWINCKGHYILWWKSEISYCISHQGASKMYTDINFT